MSKENRVSDELAACPFCGGEAELRVDAETASFDLGCSADGCAAILIWAGEDTQYLDGAISSWNLRTLPAQEPVAATLRHALIAAEEALTAEAENRGDVDEDYEANVGPVLAKVRSAIEVIKTSPQPEAVITEEMVERLKAEFVKSAGLIVPSSEFLRAALTAALKED